MRPGYAAGKRLAKKTLGQPVILRFPTLAYVEQLLERANPLAHPTQLNRGVRPASHLLEQIRTPSV
jgi:hypothetical protein